MRNVQDVVTCMFDPDVTVVAVALDVLPRLNCSFTDLGSQQAAGHMVLSPL